MIAENLLNKRQDTKALDYLYQSLEISKSIPSREEMLDNYELLAMTYARMNMKDSVSYYISQFAALSDSLSIAEKILSLEAKTLKEERKSRALFYYRIAIWMATVIILILIFLMAVRRKGAES
jgi:hypothetical protein